MYSQTCQTKMKGDSQSTSERINSNFNFTNITLKINAFKKACLQYKYTFKEVSVSHIWKIGVCKLEKKMKCAFKLAFSDWRYNFQHVSVTYMAMA